MKQIDCAVFDVGNVLVRWDPRNLYRRMGYSDANTVSILAEIGLLEINHRVLDVGEPFAATLKALIERFPRHAEFIRAFDERWVELLGGAIPRHRGNPQGTEGGGRARARHQQLQS